MSGQIPPREMVLASAGAGKTFRISSRLIALLAAGALPEQILASSFTRKAAGQILDRTLGRLADGALDTAQAQELATHTTLDPRHPAPKDTEGWAAVLQQTTRSLHRLNVGTLDAFMVGAASNFEADLGLPPGWRIGEEADESRLVSRALSTVLGSAGRSHLLRLLGLASRGEATRSIHDRLRSLMRDLLAIEENLERGVDDPWRAFHARGSPAPTANARDVLAAKLENTLAPLTSAGRERAGWRTALDEIASSVRAGDWEGVVEKTLVQRVIAGESMYSGAPITDGMRALLEEVVALAGEALRRTLGEQVEALGELTRLYRTAYRTLQREAGVFSFTDITRLIGTGDPLGSRADLYYRLDGQTRHVLLDEFQDTSLQQWEALQPLIDEVLSDDGRAATIVADPKQSIYGWRGAEPDLVSAVAERYSLTGDHLSVSWRSSQIVLDFVNDVFGTLPTNAVLREDPLRVRVAERWCEDFRDHRAQAPRPGYVALEVGPDDEGRGRDRPLLYAHVARRVAELSGAAPGFSVGILTRTNRTVARIYHELRELGVAVSQEGGTPLTDSAACEAMLALLRLADHPGDTIAAYHVARSPLGTLFHLADYTDTRAVRRVSRTVRQRLLRDGYGRTITVLARDLAPACDRREASRLGQLGELAHRYDSSSTLRPGDFVRLVEATRVEDPGSADIRIMTVHQAKGLEFDLVVLPELGSTIEPKTYSPVLTYRQEQAGRITKVLPAVGSKLRNLFPEIEEADQQRRAALWRDELSGLYVGLTRARYAVHVIAAPKTLFAGGKSATGASLLHAAITTKTGPLPHPDEATVLYSSGSPAWFEQPGAKAERAAARPGQPATATPVVTLRTDPAGRGTLRQAPSSMHGDRRVRARDVLRLDTAEAMDRGSLIHAWFEQILWSDDPPPSNADLLRIAREVAPTVTPTVVAESLTAFAGWLSSDPIRRALGRSRYSGDVSVERELPFVTRIDQAVVEGVIDRLVIRRESGVPVEAEIIDFKTDRIGLDRVPDRIEHYEPQLDAYARAVATMFSIPLSHCRRTLIFLEVGVVETLGAAPPVAPLPIL